MFIELIIPFDKECKLICGTKFDLSLSCQISKEQIKIYYDNTFIAVLFGYYYLFWDYLTNESLTLDDQVEIAYRKKMN